MDWAPPDWQPPDFSKLFELRPNGLQLKFVNAGFGDRGDWVILGSVMDPAEVNPRLHFEASVTEARVTTDDFLRSAKSTLEEGLARGDERVYIHDTDHAGSVG